MSKAAYLTLYNALCVVGWASVGQATLKALLSDAGVHAYDVTGKTLLIVQTAAVLEIVHALFRLVRSPILSAVLQVASRVLILWPYTVKSPAAQKHWSFYLMVLSWAATEVVRYTFYALKSQGRDVPKLLLLARYSLFIVLYPTGITGEILHIIASLPDLSPTALRFAIFHLLLYVPLGPYMINNMFRMRKRALKAEAAKAASKSNTAPPPRPAAGLCWPDRDPATGRSQTTGTNVAIWEAAMRPINPQEADKIKADGKKWRFKYEKHVLSHVTECMKAPSRALVSAAAGLAAAHKLFTFARDGEEISLAEAMSAEKRKTFGSFQTHIVRGEKAPGPEQKTCTVLYRDQSDGIARKPRQGKDELQGDKLKEQVRSWASRGVIEADCAAAIAAVVENQEEWCDLSDVYFVILGATSAMGPIHVLLKHGANVIACDLQNRLPRGWKEGDPKPEGPWDRLIKWTRASCGTLIMPVPADAPVPTNDKELAWVAGCNLLTQTPEIANWLVDLYPEERLVIGNYTYLDGGLHVQLSVGCDAIINALALERTAKIMACFLCTPTDDHVVPDDVADAVKTNQKNSPLWQKIVRAIIPKKHSLRSNKPVESGGLHCTRAISVAQGPNYALAKRLQHWRAMILHSRGHSVSSNVAPSTRTVSVVHNKLFALAYNGMPAFAPHEVMFQETSNAVMGALLIHDIRNPAGAANPGAVEMKNPLELFSKNSFHGGVWRCGYTLESIGLWSIVHALRNQIGAGLAGVGAIVAFVVAGPDVRALTGL